MASIVPTGFNLQGIKNSAVVDVTVSTLKETFQRLSDGLMVDQPEKGASGQPLEPLALLELADQFASSVQNLNQATLGVNDGIAINQVMDAGLGHIQDGLRRLQELALQGASSAFNDEDRQPLQEQVTLAQEEIARTVRDTSYNGLPLLASHRMVPLHIDLHPDAQPSIQLRDFSNAFTPVDVRTRAGAEAALRLLKEEREMVSDARVQLAAQESRLVNTVNHLDTLSAALTETGVRVQNADLAQALAVAAATTIRTNPEMAFQAQANQSASTVQSLL